MSCFEFDFLATLNIKTWKWPKSSLLEESKHGQFNRDQGRQEPSGEDTALMIDCNTSSSAQPESNNCCDYCASLSHNDQGGNLNSAGPGPWIVRLDQSFFQKKNKKQKKTASNRTTNLKQSDPWEQNRAWMGMNNIPSRTPYNNTVQGCSGFVVLIQSIAEHTSALRFSRGLQTKVRGAQSATKIASWSHGRYVQLWRAHERFAAALNNAGISCAACHP